MNESLIYLIIGIVAGVLSGLFGIGGGIIIIISLTLLGFSQHKAQGTSLAALLIPIGFIFGFLEYYRSGNVDIKAAILIAIGLAFGSYFGAYLANRISSLWLSKLFAVFLILMAVRLILKR
ncbi:MAG: sulfite exporter TauE/SafE family protein [candidate division WOR-3 bacterium]|nr:sulfite exporter TauE/SafE family protein [candidate division WOR-3 bacterium]MCX7948121.1 sulfite exporter TauE/SafE family protein [candidate division WOR-3 bacterium]MDW8150801.1 sulfite exporter TauE/SafE family protein [candidate division WOR-3 bacterium]